MDTTERRSTRPVKVGELTLGGGAPISIQSMVNVPSTDKEGTLAQVRALEAAGCDICRLAIPDVGAAELIRYLKDSGIRMPLVADIHFDYKIALAALAAGADKIRINPGNIGDRERVRAVVEGCRERSVPIRIGVNSGSLQKSVYEKYGAPTGEALAESALIHAAILEELDFHDIVLSVKASDTKQMIIANRILAQKTNYPLHLGVTEAGGGDAALVKSSVGIGTLLAEGIGDTVRVSLTDDPAEEIRAAKMILSTLGLSRHRGMDIVSCPTCGRTRIDLISLCARFRDAVRAEGLLDVPIKVALMGCVVNGPGEGREADIGIAGGVGEALLFSHGEIIRRIPEEKIIEELIAQVRLAQENRK